MSKRVVFTVDFRDESPQRLRCSFSEGA